MARTIAEPIGSCQACRQRQGLAISGEPLPVGPPLTPIAQALDPPILDGPTPKIARGRAGELVWNGGPQSLEHSVRDRCSVRSPNGHGTGLFGQLLAGRIEEHRRMEVLRGLQAEYPLEVQVHCGRLDEVAAANDGRDTLCRVVGHDGQVIRRQIIAAPDHIVPRRRRKISHDLALQPIDESFEARFHENTKRGRLLVNGACATSARIRPTLGSGFSERASRATAAEGEAVQQQSLRGCRILLVALALVEHRSVPVQIESLEGAENVVAGARHRSRRIYVFDADEPLPACLSGMQIARDRSRQRAEMQRSRGRGRETANVAHRRPAPSAILILTVPELSLGQFAPLLGLDAQRRHRTSL